MLTEALEDHTGHHIPDVDQAHAVARGQHFIFQRKQAPDPKENRPFWRSGAASV